MCVHSYCIKSTYRIRGVRFVTLSLEFDWHCVCFRFSELMNSALNRTHLLFLYFFFFYFFSSNFRLRYHPFVYAATQDFARILFTPLRCANFRFSRVSFRESWKIRNEKKKLLFFFFYYVHATHCSISFSLGIALHLCGTPVHVVMYLPNPNQLSCDNFSCIVHTDNASRIFFFLLSNAINTYFYAAI